MIPRVVIPILKINYVFLAFWIVLSLPAAALFQEQLFALVTLMIVGLAGMLLRIPAAATAASISLLGLIVWGKIASDVLNVPAEDSALLLLQFVIVIFLMEASSAALTFATTWERLQGKEDEISAAARARVTRWASTQLLTLAKLTIATFALSIGLLLIGGLFNVSSNQLAVSGVLVLAAVIAILILLTYRREPEEKISRI